jgi:hypothetical protein
VSFEGLQESITGRNLSRLHVTFASQLKAHLFKKKVPELSKKNFVGKNTRHAGG